MLRLLKYLKKYKIEAFLGPLFKLIEACFELVVPLVMAAMIEKGIHAKQSDEIIKQGAILLILGVLGMLFSVTAQYFSAKAAIGMASDLREDLYWHIINMSFGQFDQKTPSGYISRLSVDVNQVQNCVNMCLRLLLRSPFIVFGAMVMAFHVDAKNEIIFAVIIPILFVLVLCLILITIPFYRKVQSLVDKVVTSVRENVTGIRVIRAFGRQEHEKRSFNNIVDLLSKEQLFAGKISAIMNPLTYILVNFGILVILYQGNLSIKSNTLTQGELVALLNYMSQVLVEVIKMASLILFISKALSSAGRINAVFQMGSRDEKETNGKNIQESEVSELILKNVDFSYSDTGNKTLEDISFHVKQGEIIGVAGSMGMGKTTLLKLLAGYETQDSGEIILIDGKSLSECNDFLASHTSMVFQETSLFSGTIKENLLLAKPNATDDELVNALKVAQAYEFVHEMPKQLASKLSKMGKNLSGGQRQRLSIARGILKDRKILLLDDSFSALDYLTESKIRTELISRKKHYITFLSSQRIASLLIADKIVVLENGKQVGFDTHSNLLKNCMAYQELCRSQGIE